MEKETYKEIEKIADNIQAEAGRKRCREIENVNSFFGMWMVQFNWVLLCGRQYCGVETTSRTLI